MYDVLDVCRYVIKYSNEREYGISNLKLQKILYFIQAAFLMFKDKACFDERIEAWSFGPVVPEAYFEYKRYGSSNIPTIQSFISFDGNVWELKRVDYGDSIKREDKSLIEEVIEKFSDYSATDLVRLTHNQAPWKNAYKPYQNNEITTLSIKEYFNA